MALKKKPVTGMKDMMPSEMEVRDYVISLIKDTYKTFGFSSIETPCVEHIENLCSKQGGDNEKLIFKILKRGEKLKIKEAQEESAEQARNESQAQLQETQASTEPEATRRGVSVRMILIPAFALIVLAAIAGLTFYILRQRKREQEELARRRERRLKRLRESGVSEEEFERLRQERFGDKPGKRRR